MLCLCIFGFEKIKDQPVSETKKGMAGTDHERAPGILCRQ
jgi:hypothetical protein